MTSGARSQGERVPAISRSLLLLFRYIVRRNFRRTFHAVRVRGLEHLSGLVTDLDRPLIVYANHSSWWDPMVAFLLSEKLMRPRQHYAPMDAVALRKYKILSWLGMFPVEISSARGAVKFLRTGEAILNDGGVLWITPQGQFSDVRERPIIFKPGMAALAARVPRCAVLPLAIEYVFWNERTPEVLLSFGEPVLVGDGESADELEPRLITALESVMAELQLRSATREAQQFERVLVRGRVGVGGFYGFGQRVIAWARRRTYVPEHGERVAPRGDVAKG